MRHDAVDLVRGEVGLDGLVDLLDVVGFLKDVDVHPGQVPRAGDAAHGVADARHHDEIGDLGAAATRRRVSSKGGAAATVAASKPTSVMVET